MANVFVALRVFVQPGESNRAALNRTLSAGRIPFPLVLPTRRPVAASFATPDKLPDTDLRIGFEDYLVKYEMGT